MVSTNPTESSYACQYDVNYQIYINGCFSKNFLNDTRIAIENKILYKRTLKEQFDSVEKQTVSSKVCRYGDLTIQNEVLGMYFGIGEETPSRPSSKQDKHSAGSSNSFKDAIPAYDVPLVSLRRELERTSNSNSRESLMKEIANEEKHREEVDQRFEKIISHLGIKMPKFHPCHEPANKKDNTCIFNVAKEYIKHCGNLDEYSSSKYGKYLTFACSSGKSISHLISAFKHSCA